jgi:oligo-1,6-glucosidase
MLATLLHTLKGTPYIYQGEEIGMTNVNFNSLDDYQDCEIMGKWKELQQTKEMTLEQFLKRISEVGRDNARTPMQWSNDEYAGYSTVKPWLKVNANYEWLNVEANKKDDDSILNYYKKLLAIRKKESLVIDGNYIDLFPKHKEIYAYMRTGTKEKLLVVANYSAKNVKIDLSFVPEKYDILINNYPVLDLNNIEPYQAFILKIKER